MEYKNKYSLNDQQYDAVVATQGPLLIQAGAGSGKTKTLTQKIAYLLEKQLATPSEILAVTFTNKAAKEMRERLERTLGRPITMPYLGTFHGVCVRLLRRYGPEIGIPSNYVIYDETDKKALIKNIAKNLQIDDKKFSPQIISAKISNAKNDMIGPGQYIDHSSPLGEVVMKIYPEYERQLKTANALDFDDLIIKMVVILNESSRVRDELHKRIRYIFIDEYQDTNLAQYKLVKLLVNSDENITVVGDDWQSIYSWRGADFRNILRFEKDFSNVKVIKLEQNYRSTQAILEASHAVISKNTQRSDKKLFTELGQGDPLQIIETSNEREEGRRVAHIIQQEQMNGMNYDKIAVLYRTNAQSRSLEESLIHYNIPYKIVGGVKFYDRKEIKDILAYLRLVVQPEDIISFERIFNVPSRKIGASSLAKFYQHKLRKNLNLSQALEAVDESDMVTAAKKGLTMLNELLHELRQIKDTASVLEIIEQLVAKLDYYQYLNDGTVQGEARQENVKELLTVATQFEGLLLEDFLEQTALISDVDNKDQIHGVVTLSTIHAAKGLEFPVVVIAGMEEGIFPHSRAAYDNAELEEERRLCYVAMTRAMKRLYMTHATSRVFFGKLEYNLPSRFLGDFNAVYTQNSTNDMALRTDSFASATLQAPYDEPRYVPELEAGDQIKHGLFGVGTVIELNGSFALVYFKSNGNKKINLDFAPVRKLDD